MSVQHADFCGAWLLARLCPAVCTALALASLFKAQDRPIARDRRGLLIDLVL